MGGGVSGEVGLNQLKCFFVLFFNFPNSHYNTSQVTSAMEFCVHAQ